MDTGLTVGFALVVASLLAIAFLVLASGRIIEKTHRQSLASRRGNQRADDEDMVDRGEHR